MRGGFRGVAPRANTDLAAVRAAAHATAAEIETGRLRLLLGKPGLDGHSNGVEQIAVRARDAGFEVIYHGIRLTPQQIVSAAISEDVDCVGLSILSGGHAELVPDVLGRLRQAGAGDIPVVVGGIISPADARSCAGRAWPPCSRPGTSALPPSSAASSTRYDWPASSRRGRSRPVPRQSKGDTTRHGYRHDRIACSRRHDEPPAPAPVLPGRPGQ